MLEGYSKRIVMKYKKRGILIIIGEAQTNIGHTGQMFAFKEDDLVFL